jgi:hypothetical protein
MFKFETAACTPHEQPHEPAPRLYPGVFAGRNRPIKGQRTVFVPLAARRRAGTLRPRQLGRPPPVAIDGMAKVSAHMRRMHIGGVGVVVRDVRLLREHRPAGVVQQTPPFGTVDLRVLAPARRIEGGKKQTGEPSRRVRPRNAG